MPAGAHRFPKSYRLNRPREFLRVLRSARYRKSRGPLRIIALANTVRGARLGLIIGKRAVRAAHKRNALKRVAREVFRTGRGSLPALDVVVQLRGYASRAELRGWLREEFDTMAEAIKGGRQS